MRLPARLASASVGHQGPLGQSPLTPGRPKKKCERARGLPGGFPPPDAASSSKSLQLPGVSHVWNSFLGIATPPFSEAPGCRREQFPTRLSPWRKGCRCGVRCVTNSLRGSAGSRPSQRWRSTCGPSTRS